MKEHSEGCVICGEDLVYLQVAEEMTCHICGKKVESNVSCRKGHFICDECHSSKAVDQITRYCLNITPESPIDIANQLLKLPSVKMHGPEHHYLVPAALLTYYAHYNGSNVNLSRMLTQAQKRSSHVPGGFCGFCGACGAGIGAGIFYAIISESNPLSKKEWSDSHKMTASVLSEIAESGGPRCCKRDSFIAVNSAVRSLNEKGIWKVNEVSDWKCEFSERNNECLLHACQFYQES